MDIVLMNRGLTYDILITQDVCIYNLTLILYQTTYSEQYML